MAKELLVPYATGKTIYFHVFNAISQIWRIDSAAFENYATANIGHYNIPGTEAGSASGYYTGDFPAAVAGVYQATAQVQAGGSPAETDAFAGVQENFQWSGTVSVALYQAPANVTQWNGTAVSSPATAGIPDVNVKNFGNHAASINASFFPNVNVFSFADQAALVDTNGLPKVDTEDWNGIAQGTTANRPNVNVSAIVGTSPAPYIASAVWQDTTSGDFGVAGSIGLSLGGSLGTALFTSGKIKEVTLVDTLTTYTGNTPQTGDSYAIVNSGTFGNSALRTLILAIPTGTAPTVAQIATGIWQDATAGDFTVANSIGKSLYNSFTANTSVFTAAALANTPATSAPTVAQIVTGVWQNATPGNFTVASSIGLLLYTTQSAQVANININTDTGGAAPGAHNGLMISGVNHGTVQWDSWTVVGAVDFESDFDITGTLTVENGVFFEVNGSGPAFSVHNAGDGPAARFKADGGGADIELGGDGSIQGFLAGVASPVFVGIGVKAQVGSYATGQDPGTYVLATPAQKIATDTSGNVFIDSPVKKNTALNNFQFLMTDSTLHRPKTGLTVTATRSIDGAAFSACANAVSEIGGGWYKISLSASDLNGTSIALNFAATGADTLPITIPTVP